VDAGARPHAARDRELARERFPRRAAARLGRVAPAPYFGFELPDAPGHYFYVWLDAPVGYMSSTADWCERTGDRFDRWWENPDCEIHHFIGKDIAYFHTLFWPAMLRAWKKPLPTRVHVHGFLTVNGEKMSKRKGTFVFARTYLDHLAPDYLRYYFASKLTGTASDMDLHLDEFVAKVNADLVGKVVNLASRTARFVEGQPLAARYPDDGGLFAAGAALGREIADAYEVADTGKVTRLVMSLADRANEFVEARAPWALRKRGDAQEELRDVCTIALNLFHQLAIYLAPILPRLAADGRALLGLGDAPSWDEASRPLVGGVVGKFQSLMTRIDPERVAAVITATASGDA
jgi:methionyl-tRNA synthetase